MRLTMLGADYNGGAYTRGGPRRYSYAYAPVGLGEDNGEDKEKDPVWLRTLTLLADRGTPVAEKYLEKQIAQAESATAETRFRNYLADLRSGKINGKGFQFDVNDAMPWIIGGVVVLVAGSVIMGTRKRRR